MTETEKDLRNVICRRCAILRLESGARLTDLANKYGVDWQGLWYFENEGRFMVNLFNVYHKEYGITLEEFIK